MSTLLTFRRRHFMWFDLLEAWALTSLALYFAHHLGFWDRLLAALCVHHSDFYGALASVIGSLLGFTITAAAVLLSFVSTPQLDVVRKSPRYSDLWATFLAAMRWLGVGTAFSLVALMVDLTGDARHVEPFVTALIIAGCTARFVRCLRVFEQVIWLVVRPTP